MHGVRHHVVENTLVMGNDEETAAWRPQRIDAIGDHPQGVDVEARIGFIENCESGSRSAIWRISMRFFSPPEKPALSARLSMSWLILSLPADALTRFMKSGVESSSSPRCLRWAFKAALRKVKVATPGISTGYWNARKRPLAARRSGSRFAETSAVQQYVACFGNVVLAARNDMGQSGICRSRSAP